MSAVSLDHGYHTLTARPAPVLTDDLLALIMTYLDIADVCRCARVCRRWRRAAETAAKARRVWRRVSARGQMATAVAAVGVASARAGRGAKAAREWVHCGPVCVAAPRSLAVLCPRLRSLDVSDCAVDDAGLRAILSSLPCLRALYVRRCTVTDDSVRLVPGACQELRALSVSGCARVSDWSCTGLVALAGTLRYWAGAGCAVGDSGLTALARCRGLRYVNVRGCGGVGDEGVAALARGCARLRALDAGGTELSDAGLSALARGCPNLRRLGLRGCESVSDAGLASLARCCRGLSHLTAQHAGVTAAGLAEVRRHCRRCVILHSEPGFC